MTDLKEYKNRKIDEAFEKEDKLYEEIEIKLNKEEMRTKNGLPGKLGNEELLKILKQMGTARESTKEKIKKYK